MYGVKPFFVKRQEEEEQRRRDAERRDAALEYGYGDQNGHLTHDTWGQKQVRAPDPHPWLSGRAEEQVEEAKNANKQSEAKRLDALEHGYEIINGHYVPASAHLQRKQRKKLKPLPTEPLLSSKYMVCTQAALNPSGLGPLPNFVEKLQLLETQVGTLQQQIQILDKMYNRI